MPGFVTGHATHPDWRMALALASAPLDAAVRQRPGAFTLGLLYLTDAYAPHAQPLLETVRARFPGMPWAGTVGVGVAATGVEYIDEPALALMLCDLPPGQLEVFSGARPLSRVRPHVALVHADPATPEIGELIAEMSERTSTGYLFGGLAASRSGSFTLADGVWRGGLSGVAFSKDVALVSRVTQGSQPVGPTRRVTRSDVNRVLELDGQPALPLLLADLGLGGLSDHRAALPRLRATLVGLVDEGDEALDRGGQFGVDVRVRHLLGLDPGQQAFAISDRVAPGMRLAFCSRDPQAARRDLVRICSELRDELDGTPPLGGLYVSCAGRGGPHFGGPSAELQLVRHALGDVPLVGFFAGGEIARRHLYGYTGVLTVFRGPAP